MFSFFLFFILSSGLVFSAPGDEAENILSTFSSITSLSKRLDKISHLFLGLPYGKDGPLGEGPQGRYDKDPLYRFDTFDCTTYVETVMALALGRNQIEFENHLEKIRYEDGEVDYLKRNHFTDLQWIPFNIKNGLLDEINHLIVPESKILIAQALINLPGWILSHKVEQIVFPMAPLETKNMLLEELKSIASQYLPIIAKVSYIQINYLLSLPSILNRIPSGTIVNFVRPNWDLTESSGTHQNISHQGFLFKIKNKLYLRHATISGKVEEIPFINYLKRYYNHPTMKGIHLMRLK
jgi:hypothetical protein